MAEQISDLVINLDVDSASFHTQAAKVKNRLTGLDTAAEKTRRSIAESAKAQTEALKATMDGAAASTAAGNKKAVKSYEQVAQSVEETHRRIKAINDEYRGNESEAARLARQQDALTQSFFKQIEAIRSLKGEAGSLASVQARVRQARSSGGISQGDYLTLISELTARQKSLQEAEAKTTEQKERFLRSLKKQLTQQKLTTTELLRIKAAELGVSDAADIYIKKMEKAGDAAHGLGLKSAGARRELGVLIGELARGNFGALRGSTITLANQAGWIDKLLSLRGLAIGGLIGGIATAIFQVSKAWYQGAQEGEEFNKQLILTGNYAGKTRSELGALAKSLASTGRGFNQGDAAGALAAVVGSGSFQNNEVERISRVALEMQTAIGQSVDETIKQFQRLKDDPVNAANELDKAIHFLTADQQENIRVLAEQGRLTEAAGIAMDAYASTMDDRMPKVLENLGYLEKAWRGIKNLTGDVADAFKQIGRDTTFEEELAKYRKMKKERGYVTKEGNFSIFTDKDAAYLELLEQQELQRQLDAGREKWDRVEQERQKLRNEQNAALDRINESEESRHVREVARIKSFLYADEKKRNEALERENKRHQKALASQNKTTKYRAPAGDLASEKAQAEVVALQTQLKLLDEYTGKNDAISSQRRELLKAQAQYAVLEEAAQKRKLTTQEESLLSSKEETLSHLEVLATLGDEVARQERINKLRDEGNKFLRESNTELTRLQGLADGKTSRESGRESTLENLRTKYQDDPTTSDLILKKQQELYAAEDELRGNWLAGVKAAWGEYRDTAENVYEGIKSVAGSVFSGLSDQLTQLVTTGKSNFKDFTTSILKMIVQVINQLIVAYVIQTALGWVAGSASSSAGSANSPGVPSYRPPTRGFDVGGYTGTGRKGEVAGIVHKNEFVFDEKATKRIGVANLYRQMRGEEGYFAGGGTEAGLFSRGGINVYAPVTVSNGEDNTSDNSNSDVTLAKNLKMVIERSITDGIRTELRPGGLIYMFNRGR